MVVRGAECLEMACVESLALSECYRAFMGLVFLYISVLSVLHVRELRDGGNWKISIFHSSIIGSHVFPSFSEGHDAAQSHFEREKLEEP